MQEDPEKHPTAGENRRVKRTLVRSVLSVLLCAGIIILGFAGASRIKKTTPVAKKRPPGQAVPLVQVIPLQPADHTVVVRGMGTVVPARETVLKARVAGEVIRLNPRFTQGGYIEKGEAVVHIDPADYRLALVQRQSALVDAEAALALEHGRQAVARKEWEIINDEHPAGDLDGDLALRRPHLEIAEADVASAKAELEKARLNLARTIIRAPFNAVVIKKQVEVGSSITTQDSLAELVGTDTYWVQVLVPVDRLQWLRVAPAGGKSGGEATIRYRGRWQRRGRVIRLLADLETEGRMARILVEVPDPLDLEKRSKRRPPLLIGEFVAVELAGGSIKGAFKIPRSAFRDNSAVWIVTQADTLDIRKVTPVWRDEKAVYVTNGVTAGERLVVSDLPSPVAGMKVAEEGRERDAGSVGRSYGSSPGETGR